MNRMASVKTHVNVTLVRLGLFNRIQLWN